jgi:hypothetical protein
MFSDTTTSCLCRHKHACVHTNITMQRAMLYTDTRLKNKTDGMNESKSVVCMVKRLT